MDPAFLRAEEAYLRQPEPCDFCGMEWCECEREDES
jgi:hypothetical protein